MLQLRVNASVKPVGPQLNVRGSHPCGMGVRIQPTPALRRVVRRDYLRDMSYPLPPAYCMQGLLACNGAYELV